MDSKSATDCLLLKFLLSWRTACRLQHPQPWSLMRTWIYHLIICICTLIECSSLLHFLKKRKKCPDILAYRSPFFEEKKTSRAGERAWLETEEMNCTAAPWLSPLRQKRPCQPMPSSRNPIAAAAFGPGTSTPPSPHCRARLSPRSESTPTCWGFWPRRSSGIGLHGRPPHNVEHNVVRRPPNILHSAPRPRKVPPPSAHHEQSTRCGCTGARGRERAWPAHGRVVLLARPARRLVQPQPPPAVSAPVFAGRLCSSPPPPSQLAGRRPCLHGGRGRWDLGWTVFALPTGWTVFHLPSTPRYLGPSDT
jgi:hypothetical protein